MNNDLISREALKKAIEQYQIQWNKNCDIDIAKWNCCGTILAIIDNAPAVEPEKAKESEIIKAYTKGFDTGVETVKTERPQGESVIKCQDCKYRVKEWREDKRMKEKGYWVYGCKHFGKIMGYWGFGGNDNEFCSDAEQKGGVE